MSYIADDRKGMPEGPTILLVTAFAITRFRYGLPYYLLTKVDVLIRAI